jgi:hypothetical protein
LHDLEQTQINYILGFKNTIVKTTLRIRFFHAMIENNNRYGNDRDLFFREEEEWGRYKRMKLLIVIDMQNDFIDGALGTAEAAAIVPKVIAKIKGFDGTVLATQDTHYENYLTTQEGKNLPVAHCIVNTEGWQIRKEIADLISTEPIIKETFGSSRLPERIRTLSDQEAIESITLVGLYGYLRDFQCNGSKSIFPGSSDSCRCILLCRSYQGKPFTGSGSDEGMPDDC